MCFLVWIGNGKAAITGLQKEQKLSWDLNFQLFLNLISGVETLTEDSADLSLFQLRRSFLFYFSFPPFPKHQQLLFYSLWICFSCSRNESRSAVRIKVLDVLSFVLSINRQFYEVGVCLGVPGGWESLWWDTLSWGFQVPSALGEGTALASKSPTHTPVSLGCL